MCTRRRPKPDIPAHARIQRQTEGIGLYARCASWEITFYWKVGSCVGDLLDEEEGLDLGGGAVEAQVGAQAGSLGVQGIDRLDSG